MAIDFANADLPQSGFDRLGGGRELGEAEWLVDADYFPAPTAPTGTQVRHWNGTAWAVGTLMRWTGAAWEPATLQRWTGTAWAPV